MRLSFKAGSSLLYCYKYPYVFEYVSLYSIELCVGVTISISWVWSTCVLFISLRQIVHRAQILHITFLFLSSEAAPFSDVFGTVVGPLTCI